MKGSLSVPPLKLLPFQQLCSGVFADAPRRRKALAAVYAFARTVDDAVDEMGIDGGEPGRAREILGRWREALRGHPVIFAGSEERVREALSRAMTDFSIPTQPLLDLVDGVERDLDQTRYPNFEALKSYCHGVAGTVGVACLPIFGLDEGRHRDFAEKLGLAVQLVNIIRDVKGDALRGRIYLPLEDLSRFGYGETDLLAQVYNEYFHRLMTYQADRARQVLAEARAALPPESRRAARPALAMGRLYELLLDKIQSRRFSVFSEVPRLSFIEKLSALAR